MHLFFGISRHTLLLSQITIFFNPNARLHFDQGDPKRTPIQVRGGVMESKKGCIIDPTKKEKEKALNFPWKMEVCVLINELCYWRQFCFSFTLKEKGKKRRKKIWQF